MTIEEAKECLEAGLDHELPWDLHEAIKVALNYFYAWEKVKADVNAATITYDKAAVTEDYRTDEQKAADWCEMYKLIIISIIENRLKEVEDV